MFFLLEPVSHLYDFLVLDDVLDVGFMSINNNAGHL